MSGKLKHLRGQRGFTMVEVVMAALIFTASVVGISGMLISGSANVSRGAKETAAINMANRRLEEVKSLPFYIPWDPAKGNQDIDDYYYNVNKANGVAGDEGKHPQLDNPSVTEDYGSIPGFTDFKRTTAIEYQYVSTVGGTSHLAPAVMSTASPYSWVPNSPSDGSGQTDDPRGGANASATDEIHALVVEVAIYYNLGGAERVYKERTLVGALTTSGAFNQPYLLIQSINPNTGDYGDTSFSMTIYVKASNEFNGSSTVDVRLWRTGSYDIPATSSNVSADGTRVTSYFDLSDPKIVLNQSYNISVYWKEGGWKDEFRSCFMMVQVPPIITRLTNGDGTTQAWGYAKQSARQVIVEGDHLSKPTSVVLKDPNSVAQISGTVVNVPGVTDSHTIVVNFNLASIPQTATSPHSHWNIMVTTAGGNDSTSDPTFTDDERFYLNPPPTITAVDRTDTGNSPPSWYDWAYASQTARRVRIEGEYLYGLEQAADTSATLTYSTYETTKATYPSAQNPTTPDNWTKNTPVVMAFNPSSVPNAKTESDLHVNVNISNYGGTAVSPDNDNAKVWLNPPPTVTAVSQTEDVPEPTPAQPGNRGPNYFDWAYRAQTSRNVRIEGTYLYGFEMDGQSPQYPADNWVKLGYQVNPGTVYATSAATFPDALNTDPNEWEMDTKPILTFNPNSAGSAPNNLYWSVQVSNYGGQPPATAQGTAGVGVLMNGSPKITGVQIWDSGSSSYIDLNTLKTGSAPDSRKTGTTYQNVRIWGNYLQTSPQTIHFTRHIGSSDARLYLDLEDSSFTVGGSGTYIDFPLLNVRVNNGWDFYSTLSLNDNIDTANTPVVSPSTRYHVHFWNGDAQYTDFTGQSIDFSHKQYTCTVAVPVPGMTGYNTPSAYGAAAGGGSFWQDSSVTVTATPAGSHKFFKWTGGPAESTSASYTFSIDQNRTLNAYFWKKLYWSADGTSANDGGNFAKGYDNGPTTKFAVPPDPLSVNGIMWLNGQGTKEIAAASGPYYNYLQGLNKAVIYWKQAQSAYSYFLIGTDSTSNYAGNVVSGKQVPSTNPGSFTTPVVNEITLSSGLSSNTNYYIRVHAKGNGSSKPSELTVYGIWLE